MPARILFAAALLCFLAYLASSPASVAFANDPDAGPTPTAATIEWPQLSLLTPTVAPPPAEQPYSPPPTTPPLEQPPTAEPTFTPTHPLPSFTSTTIPTATATDTATPSPTSTSTATNTATSIPTETLTPTPSWFPPGPECYVKPGKPVLTLQVPFVHQVNDIANADGNWACGPTSVAMVLAYYGMLQPWQDAEAAKSTKPTEGSQFAPYVTEVYTHNAHTYSALAADPQGKTVAGLYGTICPTGLADWGHIKRVLEWHGLSTQHVSLSFEGVTAALKRGHPVLIGNALTASGHVLVATGYTANNQLIVNDPYGNRFAPGYGSTDGKTLYYAWNCLRPTNALEVIGTYPPPATATSTPGPATETPTATATPSTTATTPASPTVPPSRTPLSRAISPQDRPAASATAAPPDSGKHSRIEALVASSSNSIPNVRIGLAVGLMFLATLLFASAMYWLFRFDRAVTSSTRRKPQN